MKTRIDATALRREGSRSLLEKRHQGLADATALRRGGSRLVLNSKRNPVND